MTVNRSLPARKPSNFQTLSPTGSAETNEENNILVFSRDQIQPVK